MGSKKSTKRDFDWRSYSRPSRLLNGEQVDELTCGRLSPLLSLARSDGELSLQLRASQLAVYSRGVSLVRVRRTDAGLIGEVDANLRLPHAERAGAERLESWPLDTADDVARLLATVDELRADLDHWRAQGEPIPARAWLLDFAAANAGAAPMLDELVVVDVEYPYGRRKFDFVGVRRTPFVGGAGAFAMPRLVLGDLRYPGRAVGGSAQPAEFGSDAAELSHALSGEHLAHVRDEVGALLRQKQGLGLLPAEVPFERVSEGYPELVVVFEDADVADARFDAPIADLHDKLVTRRFPTEHLRFANVGLAREGAESTDASKLTVREGDVLDYRAFKGMRRRRRC
jgi:hypothetical protein